MLGIALPSVASAVPLSGNVYEAALSQVECKHQFTVLIVG
jgi:hypothetical protein